MFGGVRAFARFESMEKVVFDMLRVLLAYQLDAVSKWMSCRGFFSILYLVFRSIPGDGVVASRHWKH